MPPFSHLVLYASIGYTICIFFFSKYTGCHPDSPSVPTSPPSPQAVSTHPLWNPNPMEAGLWQFSAIQTAQQYSTQAPKGPGWAIIHANGRDPELHLFKDQPREQVVSTYFLILIQFVLHLNQRPSGKLDRQEASPAFLTHSLTVTDGTL